MLGLFSKPIKDTELRCMDMGLELEPTDTILEHFEDYHF